jgi:hypothetical protein
MHGPRAAEVQRRGGAARSNVNRAVKLVPARLVPVFTRMERVFVSLDEGAYDPDKADECIYHLRRAMAMATVAGALLKLVQAGELEERMRLLEREASEAGLDRERDRYGRQKAGGRVQWPT